MASAAPDSGVDNIRQMLKELISGNNTDIQETYNHPGSVTLMKNKQQEQNVLADATGSGAGNEEGKPDMFRFDVTPAALEKLPPPHEHLYILSYDLAEYGRTGGGSPVALIRDLMSTGMIADAHIRTCSDDLYKGLPKGTLRYVVLYSTILGPDFIDQAAGLPREQILSVDKSELAGWTTLLFNSKTRTVTLVAPDQGKNPRPLRGPEAPDVSVPAESDLPVTPDMIEQYILESDDLLEQVEHHLCCIADAPASAGEHIADAFRLIHSFKGHSGFLGFTEIEQLSHKIEGLMAPLKDAPEACDEIRRDLLLRGTDLLRSGLSELSAIGTSRLSGAEELTALLNRAMPGSDARTPTALPERPPEARTGNMSVRRYPERHDLRVNLEKLDRMVNLVGELVIAESIVTKNSDLTGLTLDNFDRSAHNLRRIISELQQVVMSVRMVPLTRTFRRLKRLVHDLALRSGKQVRLALTGEETEVDKTVIEQITDPLVHLIRNSVDHGIEFPDQRRAAGKPETGLISIEAGHEGGEVLIRISDDGRGLDRGKILSGAIDRGIVSARTSGLSDGEIDQLIFESGFTTAEDLTDVSGRGIGMDVVRRNIERLKGRVDIRSVPGEGAAFALRIPLTLAVIDGMLIRISTALYTVPLLSIRESFRPCREQITVTMSGQELVRVRNEMIPVIRLHKFYNLVPDHEALDQGILISVTSGTKSVCLFADEIIGHHQTVIKGMPEYIGSAMGISGCSILEHGKVGLILDVGYIIKMAEQQSQTALF